MFTKTNNYTLGMKIKEGIKKGIKKGYDSAKTKIEQKIGEEKEINQAIKQARFKEKKRLKVNEAKKRIKQQLNAGKSSRGDNIFCSGKENDYFGKSKKGGGYKWF